MITTHQGTVLTAYIVYSLWTDANRELYICELDGIPVGTIRLDWADTEPRSL